MYLNGSHIVGLVCLISILVIFKVFKFGGKKRRNIVSSHRTNWPDKSKNSRLSILYKSLVTKSDISLGFKWFIGKHSFCSCLALLENFHSSALWMNVYSRLNSVRYSKFMFSKNVEFKMIRRKVRIGEGS